MISRPNFDSVPFLKKSSTPAPNSTHPTETSSKPHSPASPPPQDADPAFWIPLNSDEFLPPVSRWATIGATCLLSSVGIAIGLAAITPSPVTVRSPAIVRPKGEVNLVQSPTAGRVTSITVKPGQQVQPGQAIAILDNSQLQTRQSQLAISIQQGQLQLQQLNAQIANLQAQIQAEVTLAARTTDSAQADLDRIQRDYTDRRAIAEQTVREAEANVEAARAEYSAIAKAAADGALPRLQAESKRQALAAAEARLAQARTALNPSAASIAAAQQQIAQTQARGESNLALLQRDRDGIEQQKIQIQDQVAQNQQELAQIHTQLNQTIVRATTAGEILQLNLRNPGQVVQPGEVIAQIAPSQADLVIKAKVSPEDIGKVKVGQRVNMRVSAFSYADYGTLNGTVKSIAADSTSALANDSQSSPTAPAYFEVTIQPEKTYLLNGDRQYAIRSGMEVQADIISREETILTFVLRKARLLVGV